MRRIGVILGYSYLGIALLVATALAFSVWLDQTLYRHPGPEELCYPGPPDMLILEGDPPRIELSWFPFGYHCVWPKIGGGTISEIPSWTATVQLGVCVALFLTAVAAGVLARHWQRRRPADNPAEHAAS